MTHTQTGFASYWRPTPSELASLNAGAFVSLHVWGGAHPPVSLEVESPTVSKVIKARK